MRLIDADVLKEGLFIKFGNQLPNGLFDEIDNAPTVTPKLPTEVKKALEVLEAMKRGRWIPVSERLPEESLNSVIGWDAYREKCVFVQYIDGYFQIMGSDESFDIVAWQELPKPYKEGEKDETDN